MTVDVKAGKWAALMENSKAALKVVPKVVKKVDVMAARWDPQSVATKVGLTVAQMVG